jgi:hypothetical protein
LFKGPAQQHACALTAIHTQFISNLLPHKVSTVHRIMSHARAWSSVVIILFAACLIDTSQAQNVEPQTTKFAIDLARTLIDPLSFKLIESGSHAPKFDGPAGSAKIIKAWNESANQFEKQYLPSGAVKLQTVAGAKGKSVILKFSAMSKVR